MDYGSIIKEQREELNFIEKKENIILRENLESGIKALKYPNILAVLGIRRCGKSVFSFLLAKNKKFGYINFDDERLLGIKTKDLDEILKEFYKFDENIEFIILDEIQNVKGWELFANRLRRTKKIILTGSNSNLLSGELATHLTGRHSDIMLFPFSFKEFLKFKKFKENSVYTTKEKALILNFLEEYLESGGFPEIQKFGKQILSGIYDDILFKDILLRHKIKKIEELRKLSKYLITNSGKEFSYSKTAKMLSVKHVSTISKWTKFLENAFLVFELERFDFKLKKQFVAPKKIYCIDSGLINTIGFKFSEDKGRIMENVIAVELKRRTQKNKQEIFYWKNHQQNEVDFIIKKEKKIQQLIQASYINSKEEIKERETKSLIKASKALNCNNLLVITWNYETKKTIKKQKINFIPLWKWLTKK